MAFSPYKFQSQDSIAAATDYGGRCLLGHDMGLGKTVISLMTAHKLDSYPIVVICPASIKWHWQRDCSRHFRERVTVLEGTKVTPYGFKRHPITVVNYDILYAWLDRLIQLRPKLVILDESHYLKEKSTRRTECARKLCQTVPYILALSGTPMLNNPIELWPTLNMLRPDLFPSYKKFGREFCAPKITPWGVKYTGLSKPKKLRRLLSNCMIRRTKEEVLTQLPPKVRSIIPLDISKRREYELAVDNFLAWMAKKNPKKLRNALKAEALIKVGYIKRLVAELKTKAVIDWIDDFLTESEEKLILFGLHKKILGAIEKRFKTICTKVDGSVTGRKRQIAFDKFNKRKSCRLLLGHITAAGTGWSATACSNTAFCEFDWVPGTHSQAEDRVRGIGRGVAGKQAQAFYLVAKDTIEENIVRLLQKKQETISTVLDGKMRKEDLNLFDLFLSTLIKRRKKVRS